MPSCPSCGVENAEGARFCSSCGTHLAPEEPAQARKLVTILFADVVGSTAMGEELDPEAIRGLMTGYFEQAREILERHGGTVEKFIGDAVMAVFGIPQLHEDDALRAVRAAAGLRDAFESEEGGPPRLSVRIGVNTGQVVAGDPATGQTLVTGDPVNTAARLEQAADPGEVLLGEPTHRLVRDAVETEDPRAVEAKGKAEPVVAYPLRSVRAHTPGRTRRLDTPMVGREAERARLLEALEGCSRESAARLVSVIGAAGIGKTRLVADFLAAAGDTARVLQGRCLPYGEGITFWPLAEAVRSAAGVTEGDHPDEVRRRLAELIGEAEGADSIVERLGEVLGLVAGTGAPEETFWAVRRVLEHLGTETPLVLLLEDLHWGETTLLDLIEYIAERATAPIVLVGTARPDLLDRRPRWSEGTNAEVLRLEPLSEADADRLISNLLGRASLDERTTDMITEAAEGNPLFVEEMLAMLIDEGLLRREDGAWVPTRDLSTLQVPPTIHALLASRLDALPEEERIVLSRGAVVGKVFSWSAVAMLTPEEVRPRVGSILRSLAQKELIRPDTGEGLEDDAFAIRHILIRDAAYEAIPKATRSTLHERFAEWLETRVGDRLPEYEEILAVHLEQAARYRAEVAPGEEDPRGLALRAGRLLASAGKRAAARGDHPAASNLLERSTSLLAPGDPHRIDVQLDLTESASVMGELLRAREILEEASRAASTAADPRLDAMVRLTGWNLRLNTDPDLSAGEVVEGVRRLLPILEEAGDDAGLAKAWRTLGSATWTLARAAETAEAMERAIEHARRAGDAAEEAEAMMWLAMGTFTAPGTIDDGLRLADRIEGEAGPNTRAAAFARMGRGILLAQRGDPDEGRRALAEGQAILDEVGAGLERMASNIGAAWIERLAGRHEEALRILTEGDEALERMGETGFRSTMASELAGSLCDLGRYEEADRYARISEETSAPDDLASQVGWRMARGRALAATGRSEDGRALVREAVSLAATSDFIDEHAEAILHLARLLHEAGEVDEARSRVREVIALLEPRGYVMILERARNLLRELDDRAT